MLIVDVHCKRLGSVHWFSSLNALGSTANVPGSTKAPPGSKCSMAKHGGAALPTDPATFHSDSRRSLRLAPAPAAASTKRSAAASDSSASACRSNMSSRYSTTCSCKGWNHTSKSANMLSSCTCPALQGLGFRGFRVCTGSANPKSSGALQLRLAADNQRCTCHNQEVLKIIW